MAVAAPAPTPQQTHHGPPRDERPWFKRPGFPRAFLFFAFGAAFAYLLVSVVRDLYGFSNPWHDWNAVLQVGLLAAPLLWLVGFGAFDYWFYWAAGRPTRPEDHSG